MIIFFFSFYFYSKACVFLVIDNRDIEKFLDLDKNLISKQTIIIKKV